MLWNFGKVFSKIYNVKQIFDGYVPSISSTLVSMDFFIIKIYFQMRSFLE